ncbi:hypothetical protein GOV04_04695 [Candidatus Woesearchaeota archaeon]|nr:hypothetical protein [Candidatus Woesearchaeota archaeon]
MNKKILLLLTSILLISSIVFAVEQSIVEELNITLLTIHEDDTVVVFAPGLIKNNKTNEIPASYKENGKKIVFAQCQNGQAKSRTCENGQTQLQVCENYQWSDWSECPSTPTDLTEYINIDDPYTSNLKIFSSLPATLTFYVDNNASTDFEWLPATIHYEKLDSTANDPIFTDYNPGMNPLIYPNVDGLAQEFYDYTCTSPRIECLKPYIRAQTTSNVVEWDIDSLTPGVPYNIHIVIGEFPQITVHSQTIMISYT